MAAGLLSTARGIISAGHRWAGNQRSALRRADAGEMLHQSGGALRHVTNRRLRPRRRLLDRELTLEVERIGAVCPLSPGEITEWARKLGGAGADGEPRLQTLVTYWFYQANSFSQGSKETDAARIRDYFERRLEQGDSPDTVVLPPHLHRIYKWLPYLANRLSAICAELLSLPDDVDAALHIRFAEYAKALDYFSALPIVLNAIAEAWHRPRPGQPSLELESGAVGLLTCAIEDYTGEEFPPPRSYKRLAEIELVRLLAARLFPSFTPAQIETMLQHFHKRRLDKARAERRLGKSIEL
jgi:hypothetical protein